MKKVFFLVIVIVFFLCLTIQNAQDFTWKKTKIPSVGIKAMELADFHSILYVLTSENKIFRLSYYPSDNSEYVEEITPDTNYVEYTSMVGDNDILLFVGTKNNGIYRFVQGFYMDHLLTGLENVHITSLCYSGYIFAGSKSGMYKSSNFGKDWIKLDNQLNEQDIIAFGGPIGTQNHNYSRLFVSTRDSGVYQSIDEGLTFQQTAFPLGKDEIIKSFYDNYDTIYAISDSNIFYYDFNDTTWKKIELELPSEQISSLICYNYDSSSVFHSNKENSPQSLPYFDKKMVSSYDKGILNLENNTWIEINNGLNDKRIISLMAGNSRYGTTGNIFAGTESDGVYRFQIKLFPSIVIDNNSTDLKIAESNDWLVKLKLNLLSDDYVNLELYDLQGNKVKDIFRDYLSKGEHSLDLDISGLQSGIYFIKLQMNGKSTVKKMLVAR